MSDHGTHQEGDNTGELKSKTAFRSSFWFVIILIGLFIAALNFISIMGNGEAHEAKEATATETLKGETGLGREKTADTMMHTAASATKDSVGHEAHH